MGAAEDVRALAERARVTIVPLAAGHLDFARGEMTRHWGSPVIYSRDKRYDADRLPGFVALRAGEPVGHVTYAIAGDECEVVTLSATIESAGIGTALLAAAAEQARASGCRRAFLTTSNDNLRALAFYQKRGWRLVAVLRGAVDRCRERQKDVPLIGLNGIPLHDEIELELPLGV